MFGKAALALGLLLGSTGLALADSNRIVSAGSVSAADITNRLTSLGLSVRNITVADHRYKVITTDAGGHRQTLIIDPITGQIIPVASN